jgi:hypothetical protein
LQAPGRGRALRSDQPELRAPSADVHHQGVALYGLALRDADERQVRLLLVGQDVERRARRPRDLVDDPRRVGGAPERFGPEEQDRRCSMISRCRCIAAQCCDELRTSGVTKGVPFVDGVAEPEEDGLVRQRFETVTVDRGASGRSSAGS